MFNQLKAPTDYTQQISLLKSRGIIVEDDSECEFFLHRVNYYRLSGYILPFRKYNAISTGLSFRKLESIYYFDTELRNLLSLTIEKIEIYLRSQLSYFHAHAYGANGYMDPHSFNSKHNHIVFTDKISKCISDNSSSPVIRHHIMNYGGQFPIWVIIDYFSLGMLSYFFTDMINSDKATLAMNMYGTSYQVLSSWLRCLTDLRNRCAHYSRLYYWTFTAVPKGLKRDPFKYDSSLFSQLYMLKHLYPESNRWNSDFYTPLLELIDTYNKSVDVFHLGFPSDWDTLLKQ